MPDQLIQYALAAGLDTRTDAHSQELGALDTALNVVFDKAGAVRKRHGNVAQPATAIPGGTFTPPVQTGALPSSPAGLGARGGEQVLIAGTRLFSLAPDASAHISKDQINEAVATRRPLHGSQAAAFGAGTATQGFYSTDVAQTSDGFRAYVWLTSRAAGGGDVYVSIHDTTSPTLTQVFFAATALNQMPGGAAASMARPQIIALGTALVIVMTDPVAGNFWANTITRSGAGWTVGPNTQLFASSPASAAPPNPYDIVTDDGIHFTVAWQAVGVGTGIKVTRYSPDLGATGTYAVSWTATAATDAAATFTIALLVNAGNLWVVWKNPISATPSGGFRVAIYAATTGAVVLSSRVTTGGLASSDFYTSLIAYDSTHVTVIAMDASNGLLTGRIDMFLAIVDLHGGGGGLILQPISRAFAFGAKVYVLTWMPSALQGTYAWMDVGAFTATSGALAGGGRVVAIVAPRLVPGASSAMTASGPRAYGTMSSVVPASGSAFVSGIGVVLGGSLPGSPSSLSLWETRLDFAHPNIGTTAPLGRNLIVAQGVYDGAQVTEFGFDRYPEGYSVVAGSSGSLTPSSTYTYAVVWEWLTDAGELVISTTQAGPRGQVASVTLTAGQNSTTVMLSATGQSLLPTTKTDPENLFATPPTLAIYRSQANGGTTMTRIAGLAPTAPGTYPTSYFDGASDTSIAANAPLYFAPGQPGTVLDNVAPPSFSHTIAAFGRIWGIGDDLRTIWFSQSYVEGFQPGFNENLTLQVEDGGDLVALGPLNQNLVIFTATRIYMTYGTGPDATGGGTPFPPPQLVQSDVGCIDPRSVVGIPDGLVFLSAQGLCIVGQDFSVTYLDAPEDVLKTYPTIRSAVLVPEHHEVRFALDNGSSGVVLCLNYWAPANPYKYKWSIFQLYDSGAAVSGAIVTAAGYVGGYRWAAASGNPYTEDTTGATYMDGGSAIANWVTMTVVTSWIAVNGIVGYQRGKRAAMIGDWYTSHDLSLGVATDFQPSTSNSAPTGQSHTFSSDLVEGGPLDRFVIHVKNQKHQALQFSISDAYPTGARAVVGSGQGFSLAGLALQAVTKPGVGKLLANNRSA